MNQKRAALLKKRIIVTMGLFLVAVFGLVVRLGYLQIIKGPVYSQEALKHQYRDEPVIPQRGDILDRNGKELAISIPKKDLWVENQRYDEEEKNHIAEVLASILDQSKEVYLEMLASDKERFAIAKFLDSEQVQAIKEANLPSVWFDDSSMRHYPYGHFASYLIGHVNANGDGMAGVESSYNQVLKGVQGRKIFIKDAHEQEISIHDIAYFPPVEGHNLVLTMDEFIQHQLEIRADQALESQQAKRVIAIAADPKTGDILGMTSKPDYDPNYYRQALYPLFQESFDTANDAEEKLAALYRMWRNPAVNDIYEPGSPFKLITTASALDENKVQPDEWFYDEGFVKVGNWTIRNWTNVPYRDLTFTDALVNSVNSVFIQVANRIGKDIFFDYIHAFGFGQKTGIDLPGEELGIVAPEDQRGDVKMATTAFGQGISVTPIQMIQSVSAISNGGKLMKPRVVKEIVDKEGQTVERYDPQMVKQVISKETSETVLGLMEEIPKTLPHLFSELEGYRIGGKSGTAQKAVEGGYSETKFIGSFVGVIPIEDPKLVVLVVVDEPGTGINYGSVVAAPTVAAIMSDVVRYMGIQPTNSLAQKFEQSKVMIPEVRNIPSHEAIQILEETGLSYQLVNPENIESDLVVDCFPKPGNYTAGDSPVFLYMKSQSETPVIMPDVLGMTMKEAQLVIENLGLLFSSTGEGKAIRQMPSAGTRIEKGYLVNIEFSKDKLDSFDEKEQNLQENGNTNNQLETGEREQP